MSKIRIRIAGVGAKGASMFLGSLQVGNPAHSYRIGSFGGGASVASLVITDWFDVKFALLNKIGALNEWYITIEVESTVIGVKDTKVKLALSTKEKHFDLDTPVRVECIGIALEGIKLDGKLLVNDGQDDPRFDPRSMAGNTEAKAHMSA